MADSEEEIWDYGKNKRGAKNSGYKPQQSLGKRASRVQKTQKIRQKGASKKNNGLKIAPFFLKKSNTSMANNASDAPEPESDESSCPFCQMPFSCVGSDSPRKHTMECMDVPLVATAECAEGLSCKSKSPGHYRLFRHSLLAQLRAGQIPEGSVSNENHKQVNPVASSPENTMLDGCDSQLVTDSLLGSSSCETFATCEDSKEDICHIVEINAKFNASDHESKPPELIESAPELESTSSALSGSQSSGGSVPMDIKLEALVEKPTEEEVTDFELTQLCDEFSCDSRPSSVTPDENGDCSIKAEGERTKMQCSDAVALSVSNSSLSKPTLFRASPKKGKKMPELDTNQTSLLSFFKPKAPKGNSSVSLLPSRDSSSSSRAKSSSFTALRKSSAPTTKFKNRLGTPTAGSSDDSLPSNSRQSQWTSRANKKCPFYKKIPGTPFTVDAFSYGVIPGCSGYFLSHFHYDHYGGLTKKFQEHLYCYKVTGNLVEKRLGVLPKHVHKLEMNKLYVIEGIEVTLLDANHCPGSVLFLFRLPDGRYILHTGDFRASVDMESYPELTGVTISELYLDTTYCDSNYVFPPQHEVIEYGVNLACQFKAENPGGLIVVGSYTIGKERIFLAIAEALNSKVCVTRDKRAVLQCLENPWVESMLTSDPSQASVHVLPMGHLRFDNLVEYLNRLKPRFDSILAIEPTGWTHNKKGTGLQAIRPKRRQNSITIYGVPYSEHSSYAELKRFVQFISPAKILPTVNNGNPESRKRMQDTFHQWLKEKESSPSKKLKQTALGKWFSPKKA